MNNKCYIAGRVTGDPNYKAKFHSAVATVVGYTFFDRNGHKIAIRSGRFSFRAVNPTAMRPFGIPIERYPYAIAMLFCLIKLSSCSYAYFLSDWKDSLGANIEHRAAKFLGKEVIYQ